MPECRQLRVSGGPEGRSERPAMGHGQPRPWRPFHVKTGKAVRLRGRGGLRKGGGFTWNHARPPAATLRAEPVFACRRRVVPIMPDGADIPKATVVHG